MLSDEMIIRGLADYDVQPTRAQCEQLRTYISLLLKWNRSISLTTVTDEIEILKFHFGESAFALRAIPGIFGRLADVGSGAGFPGIPVRIFNNKVDLLLVESNAKKCAFLSELIRALSLENARVVHSRFEDTIEDHRGCLDVVVSRALGDYEDMAQGSANVLRPGGKLVLWVGADDSREIAKIPGWRWSPSFPIPKSARRVILAGERT